MLAAHERTIATDVLFGLMKSTLVCVNLKQTAIKLSL